MRDVALVCLIEDDEMAWNLKADAERQRSAASNESVTEKKKVKIEEKGLEKKLKLIWWRE
jgi:hypothetical protein